MNTHRFNIHNIVKYMARAGHRKTFQHPDADSDLEKHIVEDAKHIFHDTDLKNEHSPLCCLSAHKLCFKIGV